MMTHTESRTVPEPPLSSHPYVQDFAEALKPHLRRGVTMCPGTGAADIEIARGRGRGRRRIGIRFDLRPASGPVDHHCEALYAVSPLDIYDDPEPFLKALARRHPHLLRRTPVPAGAEAMTPAPLELPDAGEMLRVRLDRSGLPRPWFVRALAGLRVARAA